MPNALASGAVPAGMPGAPGGMPSGAPAQPMPGAPGADQPPQKTTTLPEIKAAIKKQASIDSKMRGLLKDGKPVERNKAVDMCISLVSEGVFSAEQMAGYLMTLPTDPMKVREWIEGHAKKVEANMDQMIQMIHGQETLEPGTPPSPVPPGTMPGDPTGVASPDPMAL